MTEREIDKAMDDPDKPKLKHFHGVFTHIGRTIHEDETWAVSEPQARSNLWWKLASRHVTNAKKRLVWMASAKQRLRLRTHEIPRQNNVACIK